MATLYDKIWASHEICKLEDGSSIMHVDRHLIQDVTSPQAFEHINVCKRKVCHPELALAVADHNAPTNEAEMDELSKIQVNFMRTNCRRHKIKYIEIGDVNFGIVHVIAPELGLILPGSLVVCGDSHTSTHGAFGSLAFGIGTGEIEHVLATQTIILKKQKNLLIEILGKMCDFVTVKDVILHVISRIGASGGIGSVIEYTGNVVSELAMDARMTLCNMTIEAGSICGLIAPDVKTIEYLQSRKFAPKGRQWNLACDYWKVLKSDSKADFDKTRSFDISNIEPQVTWGTTPAASVGITQTVPFYEEVKLSMSLSDYNRQLDYMGLVAGQKMRDLTVDKVFIGACTNSRLDDLRAAAAVVKGKKVHSSLQAIVVPGSYEVKKRAEQEGLDRIFKEAGFEWRTPGCSMCIGINSDRCAPYERCASTSNRNFEGRQGVLSRTHLMSPVTAAATAITGKITDVREIV